jgi:hypothetical protein
MQCGTDFIFFIAFVFIFLHIFFAFSAFSHIILYFMQINFVLKKFTFWCINKEQKRQSIEKLVAKAKNIVQMQNGMGLGKLPMRIQMQKRIPAVEWQQKCTSFPILVISGTEPKIDLFFFQKKCKLVFTSRRRPYTDTSLVVT